MGRGGEVGTDGVHGIVTEGQSDANTRCATIEADVFASQGTAGPVSRVQGVRLSYARGRRTRRCSLFVSFRDPQTLRDVRPDLAEPSGLSREGTPSAQVEGCFRGVGL